MQKTFKNLKKKKFLKNTNYKLLIIFIQIIFNLKLFKTNITYFISKDKNEEYKDAQEYIYMIFNGTLYNPNKILKKSHKPKISITMAVYNA